MGCGASLGSQRARMSPTMRRMFKQLEKETTYSPEELERLWIEVASLSDGKDNENLMSAFMVKHKFGRQLIKMTLKKFGLDPLKVRNTTNQEAYYTDNSWQPANLEIMFPILVKILHATRKAPIEEQLTWYFQLFDVDDSGELSPEELVGMVRVILSNNPAMAEYASSEGIGKLVEEVFQEADDDGNGVLNLGEILNHSQFITKKLLMQNTNFVTRYKRLMKKMRGEGAVTERAAAPFSHSQV